MLYSCPVEWRDNRRAVWACGEQILIEDGQNLPTKELFDIYVTSAVFLNSKELFFSYKTLNSNPKQQKNINISKPKSLFDFDFSTQ